MSALTQSSMRHLVIVGFVIAMALAAGVWLVDFGFLTPPEIKRESASTAPVDVVQKEDTPWYVPGDWSRLSENLEELRRPVVIDPPTPVDDEDEPEVEPEPVREVRLPKLTWKYKGFITVGDTRRALVELDTGEEIFITTKSEIADQHNMSEKIRVVEILDDRLIVQRGQIQREEVERFRPDNKAEGARTASANNGVQPMGDRRR